MHVHVAVLCTAANRKCAAPLLKCSTAREGSCLLVPSKCIHSAIALRTLSPKPPSRKVQPHRESSVEAFRNNAQHCASISEIFCMPRLKRKYLPKAVDPFGESSNVPQPLLAHDMRIKKTAPPQAILG